MQEEAWPLCPPPAVHGRAYQWQLSSVAQLPTARADLRELLTASASSGVDESLEGRCLLTFEELASNGLRHGLQPVQARVIAAVEGVLVEVSDSLPERPPKPAAGRDPAFGGLGLPLVARLTAAHGWLPSAGRKSVWAYCHCAAPT